MRNVAVLGIASDSQETLYNDASYLLSHLEGSAVNDGAPPCSLGVCLKHFAV